LRNVLSSVHIALESEVKLNIVDRTVPSEGIGGLFEIYPLISNLDMLKEVSVEVPGQLLVVRVDFDKIIDIVVMVSDHGLSAMHMTKASNGIDRAFFPGVPVGESENGN